METIAVHCSWADARLMRDDSLLSLLPLELTTLIRVASGPKYLEALASASLLPQCTDRLFSLYKPLTVELAARWIKSAAALASIVDSCLILSSLSRLLPLAQYLKGKTVMLLQTDHYLSKLRTADRTILDLTEEQLLSLLLAFFRLFTYDPDTFGDFLHPALLPILFDHHSLPVRYLAIQCFVQLMNLADALSQKMVEKHVGYGAINGLWDGRSIDYRILKLVEEGRWERLQLKLNETHLHRSLHTDASIVTRFSRSDLSPETAELGGVLLPREGKDAPPSSHFVHTPTTMRNLSLLSEALLYEKPIILSGERGSGKTSLIHEAAKVLNKFSTMVTLQLNEQTDAKSLIGIYSTSHDGTSFIWQPGILTKALQEGRWVLIEDIETAPSDVLGVLRPIIEQGELFLPSRKQYVRPADGFRMLATTRVSSAKLRNGSSQLSQFTNVRLWSNVEVARLGDHELVTLLHTRFPELLSLIDSVMSVHRAVIDFSSISRDVRSSQTRPPTTRDLLKWCRRIQFTLNLSPRQLGNEAIPEKLQHDIFKDAVDCYAGYNSSASFQTSMARCIARHMQISPQQMKHLLQHDLSNMTNTGSEIQFGRRSLKTLPSSKLWPRTATSRPFAFTQQARNALESIASATSMGEPLLLVGETGIGKTTLVQHLASVVGQRLTVINLSQQSEASDLLGGLKPVTVKSLILPMIDQFALLFVDTFSARRNEKFQSAIKKAVASQNWPRLLLLWQEAVQLAEHALQITHTTLAVELAAPQSKRRKIAATRYQTLRDRWAEFTIHLQQAQNRVTGEKGRMAFAYVEGRLIQAVRNGEWLLLDEINLASSDTLDHIIGLLQNYDGERPSVMLYDTGKVDRVVAHPDFRVFAAMNPATDTGKKDLTPDLRSRFTEIYVDSGDNDIDDLVEVIQTYLGSMLSVDRRAAFDLGRAYLSLKKLNEELRLTDGAGDIPHFTLRSLVRCLLYVAKQAAVFGLRRAMYEGFAMSFFTMLCRESERLVVPILESSVLGVVKNPRSFLAQLPKAQLDEDHHVSFKHHRIIRGSLEVNEQPHYIVTPSVERNLLNLARATSMQRFPILLQGPTSSGKTSMVEYLAKMTGNKFVRINNHEHTDLQEYLGSYVSGTDGKLQYTDGVLVDALRRGHWIVLDELNLAPSDVLEALNRLLDDNRELLIPESQEVVRPHRNFMLFATQNPAGLYGGRKRLSRAFRNRFLELHFDDIPEDELEVILRERSQIAPSFCTQIVAVYKKLALQRQSSRLFEQRNSFATLRDLFRWAARPVDDRQQLAFHGYMLLAERVRDVFERDIVRRTIEEVFRVTIDERVLYSASGVLPDLGGSLEVVWTPAMRRLFVLVSAALMNNEPVLLVGETGCGKTQICQTVAVAMRTRLNTYNAHTNTETGDLIGSQRPIRNRAEMTDLLRKSFEQTLGYAVEGVPIHRIPVEDLILYFERIDPSAIDSDRYAKTQAAVAAYRALFHWVDGSLVSAMRRGEHFLLDEISLADDSVLERLNSVLEPSRTVLLAEKGSQENVVVAASGFQFLATMNPGGDYGKRELSAAMRNRLTEIWVPPLISDDDVLPIVQSKLGTGNAKISSAMLEFANWFRDCFESTNLKTIRLRGLLAWAGFIQVCSHLSPEVALIHGASMVYIDSLGANPAGMTTVSHEGVEAARQRCLRKLSELLGLDAGSVYARIPALKINSDHLSTGDFRLQRYCREIPNLGLVFDAPTTLKNTMRIVRGLQLPRPILLEGNPGVGKTAIVTALAQVVGKSLIRINLSDQTDLMDLFGADVPVENESIGTFSWRDGPLLQAMQSGGWVLLDEMNLASQSVLEGLNSCLDHRQEVFVSELDRTFTCHPEFRIFAAQNPHHQGGGRKGLPASFVNRFTVVYADAFQKVDLDTICRNRFDTTPVRELEVVLDVINRVESTIASDSRFSSVGGPWEFNLRDVNRWLELVNSYPTLEATSHFEAIVLHRLRNANQREIAQRLLGGACYSSSQSLYNNLTPNMYQVGSAFMRRDENFQYVSNNEPPIATRLLPFAKHLMLGVNQGWPIILSGSSGSGKTTLVRHLAAVSGAHLVEVPLNADVDTMDFIGGFEQYDSECEASAVRRRVRHQMKLFIIKYVLDAPASEVLRMATALHTLCNDEKLDYVELADALEVLSKHDLQLRACLERVQEFSLKQKDSGTRFVWNDGVLIDALERGSWLVLDNANQCNPSVLDRLNSLLEPNGNLIISENHIAGATARVVKPHADFRIFLTMDPRYGELSRAMRNRSFEMHIPSDERSPTASSGLYYASASEIARYRQLKDANYENPLIEDQLTGLAIDHLSSSELQSSVWENADLVGMLEVENVYSQLKARQSVPAVLHESINELSITSRAVGKFTNTMQPTLLALNDPVLALAGSEALTARILLNADLRHAWIETFQLRNNLEQTAKEIISNRPSQMTLLEKSSISNSKTRSHDSAAPPFMSFLLRICDMVEGYVANAPRQALLTDWQLQNLQSVIAYAGDIFDLSKRFTVELGSLQAYIQIGYDICQTTDISSSFLAGHLLQALQLFQRDHGLGSGRGLQLMWDGWRPLTPLNNEHLDRCLQIELLVQNFDKVTMTAGRPRKDLVDLRVKLVEFLGQIWKNCADTVALAQELERVVGGLNTSQGWIMSDPPGHFKQWFADLNQIIHIGQHSDNTSNPDLESIALLAKRPTSRVVSSPTHSPVPRLLDNLSGLALEGESGLQCGLLDRSSFFNLVGRLVSCEKQSLGALNYALEELSILAKSICVHAKDLDVDLNGAIRKILLILMDNVLISHEAVLSREAKEDLPKADGLDSEQGSARVWERMTIFEANLPRDHHFGELLRTYLMPAVSLLSSESDVKPENVALALIKFSISSLGLLVPDRASDPALLPTIQSQCYARRVSELRTRIQALKIYQERTTGQISSLLIRTIEKELAALGPAPLVPEVVRPVESGLHRLQEIYNIVLRAIVERVLASILPLLNRDGIHPVDSRREELRDELLHMQQTIWQTIQRLNNIDRAYDDLSKPITWLLKCLFLGLQLHLVTMNASTRNNNHVINQICRHAPMLGGTPMDVLSWAFRDLSDLTDLADLRILWLEHLSLRRSLCPSRRKITGASDTSSYLTVVDSFFRDWKSHLTKEQAAAATNSRYYAYRGQDDESEAVDLEELRSLFPTFDDSADGSAQTQQVDQEVRDPAIVLATLQAIVFSDSVRNLELSDYVVKTLEKLSASGNDIASPQKSAPASATLPGIILLLDLKVKSLNATQSPIGLNIYTDGDIVESRKLFQLVDEVASRFHSIQAAWPEHAVPGNVLQFCREILEFELQEPIAKFLTKTEKLLELVGQWEAVASREFSAVSLQQKLTQLIVHWRQRELASWAQLLDLEQSKHERHAQAWFFMLYEATVINVRAILRANGDVSAYAEELVQMLEEFLRTTSRGQFSSRLRIVGSFQCLLSEVADLDARVSIFADSVHTILQHYQRYLEGVENPLKSYRTELEQSVQEQIKLASWKDTNPTALKDSARRSHHKLFKIVRKYRAFLEQPVITFQANSTEHNIAGRSFLRPVSASKTLADALACCQKSVSGWESRPERLTNPLGAALSMLRVYHSKMGDFRIPNQLWTYRTELSSAISDLRKQTPCTLTSDNESLVRHLKERKKRLLADTFKDVAKMGVRRNLGAKELNSQSSIAKVLSSSPNLISRCSKGYVVAANEAFHEFLDYMPKVRQALADHSEDLTDAETRRAVGSLEGLLSFLVEERRALSIDLTDLCKLESQIKKLQALELTSDEVRFGSLAANEEKELVLERLGWLPEIAKTTAQILAIHDRNTGEDHDLLARLLHQNAEDFTQLRKCIEDAEALPAGLLDNATSKTIEQGLAQMQRLRDDLERYAARDPAIAYIIREATLWMNTEELRHGEYTNGIQNPGLEEFDLAVRRTSDLLFVALQRMSEANQDDVESSEEVKWLTRTTCMLAAMKKSLHVNTVTETLTKTYEIIPHLQAEDVSAVVAILAVASPSLEQYYRICTHITEHWLATHIEVANMAALMARTLCTLASDGFCSPAEAPEGDEKAGTVEAGTGLGEGEGAEDISKDVGDDEDLTELAQAETTQAEENSGEVSKDAVDMGKDELNGNDDDAYGEADEDREGASGSEPEGVDEMDEETGSVDDLDPTAVDEKMWDDVKKEAEKEVESGRGKGQKADDDVTGQEGRAAKGSDDEGDEDDTALEDDGSTADDEEAVEHGEAENIDPRVQEEQAMQLPEDMQLNGEEKADDSGISDEEMDGFSDVEDAPANQNADLGEVNGSELSSDAEPDGTELDEGDQERLEDDIKDQLDGQDTDVEVPADSEHEESLRQYDKGDAEFDQDADHDTEAVTSRGPQKSNEPQEPKGMIPDAGTEADMGHGSIDDTVDETVGGKKSTRQGTGRNEAEDSPEGEAVKKLAELLDKWYQGRKIKPPGGPTEGDEKSKDVDMADVDFEHAGDDADEADAEAMDVAEKDHGQDLKQGAALEEPDRLEDQVRPLQVENEPEQQESIEAQLRRLHTDAQSTDQESGAFVPNDSRRRQDVLDDIDSAADELVDQESPADDDSDADQSNPPLTANPDSTLNPLINLADATRLWSYYSTSTHQSSLILTEQLRLILAPTLATKLRGDYRTGKRLNIKRIIPYVASGYKKDKIWMRRSVPSKRAYQIMIAVDDSRSMREGGVNGLAMETLVLVAKSLSMLEVGEICVVGFGDQAHVRVAHPFGQTFSNESGPEVLSGFAFDQKGTDVRRLVEESINLFQEARNRQASSQAELWQLELIVSDGVCEEHETIRRLVRKAMEEKIMIVFVIVDSVNKDGVGEGGKGTSIMDLTQASFEPDPEGKDGGEMKLTMRRYLERFPFPYYLVVRDVRDLPGVLSTALKGWFSQVVDLG